ncbi:hypothetical protein NXS19_008867 [Fusarium pseudograminearum]|nr:hypothetical protein NXS19_008867 [Fusarium pseudograminearum]
MKALRRSIKGDKDKGPVTPKSAVAIVPPKKVIRALYDYEARSSQELSFSRGDFFHVIGRENDDDWYEACNPALPDARGLVPVTFFQALGRTERDSAQSDGGQPPPRLRTPTTIPDTASRQQCILHQQSCHLPQTLRPKATNEIPSQSERQVPWFTESSCTTLLRKERTSWRQKLAKPSLLLHNRTPNGLSPSPSADWAALD